MKFAYVNSKNALVPRVELEGIDITENRVGFAFSNGKLRICDTFESNTYKLLDVGPVYMKVMDMINDKNDERDGYCVVVYHHEIKKILDDLAYDEFNRLLDED
jgi:hypothetical protein